MEENRDLLDRRGVAENFFVGAIEGGVVSEACDRRSRVGGLALQHQILSHDDPLVNDKIKDSRAGCFAEYFVQMMSCLYKIWRKGRPA